MRSTEISGVFIVLALLDAMAFAESPLSCLPHIAKTNRVCCLKNYGYNTERLSAPTTGVSFEDTTPPPATPSDQAVTYLYRESDIKRFPLRQSELTIDHCQIASVSTIIRRDGTWAMSFRATQNPDLVSRQDRPKFVRFTQNHFYVTLRVFAGYRIATDPASANLARPAVAQFPAASFWLRRGETSNEFVQSTGTVDGLARQFDRIDRVEVDLQYE